MTVNGHARYVKETTASYTIHSFHQMTVEPDRTVVAYRTIGQDAVFPVPDHDHGFQEWYVRSTSFLSF